MGVWIEILPAQILKIIILVTPCVGVWIEIADVSADCAETLVTPCVGVWIEIVLGKALQLNLQVTPCVGVWIEIEYSNVWEYVHKSLPAWECGLKSINKLSVGLELGHSLRGSVD